MNVVWILRQYEVVENTQKLRRPSLKRNRLNFAKKEFYLLLMETCSINVLGGHNVPVLKCKFKDFLIEKNTDES